MKVITVRTTAFEPAAERAARLRVEAMTLTGDAGLSKLRRRGPDRAERPELTSARW